MQAKLFLCLKLGLGHTCVFFNNVLYLEIAEIHFRCLEREHIVLIDAYYVISAIQRFWESSVKLFYYNGVNILSGQQLQAGYFDIISKGIRRCPMKTHWRTCFSSDSDALLKPVKTK